MKIWMHPHTPFFTLIMNILSQLVGKIVSERPSIKGGHVENFDGLRAIAALMVMSMHIHTIPGSASGFTGVYLFFALSGYLLYSGLLRFCDTINASTIFAYLTRRVFRIIPLYLFFTFTYAYIFKGWNLQYQNDLFLSQLFFSKYFLHLWTVHIEMILYLFLPLIIIMLSLFKNGVTRSIVLIGTGIVTLFLYYQYAISIAGTQYYIAIFMFGMAAVHLKSYVPEKMAPIIAYISFAMIFLLSWYIPQTAFLRNFFGLTDLNSIYQKAYVFFGFSFLLLMALTRFKSRFWGNKWLRLVGVCGYGYYLWHPMMIEMAANPNFSRFTYQVLAYSGTLLIAIVTYLLIEKPLIRLGRLLSDKIKENKVILLGIRPWVLCMIFAAAFFSYRCLYVFDECNIKLQVTIWAPDDTISQIFLPYEDHYTEKVATSAAVKGNKWQTVSFTFKPRKINAFRFDPGTIGGEYRIKDFSITFPLTNTTHQINLEGFSSEKDIDTLSLNGDYLKITADKSARDPIIIYTKDLPDTWITSETLLLLLIFLPSVSIMFLLFFVLDKFKIPNRNF